MLRLGREERVLPSSPHTAKDWSHGEGEKRKGKRPPSPTPHLPHLALSIPLEKPTGQPSSIPARRL